MICAVWRVWLVGFGERPVSCCSVSFFYVTTSGVAARLGKDVREGCAADQASSSSSPPVALCPQTLTRTRTHTDARFHALGPTVNDHEPLAKQKQTSVSAFKRR